VRLPSGAKAGGDGRAGEGGRRSAESAARRFPWLSGGLADFIRRLHAVISKSNAYIDLSISKKCPLFFNFLSLRIS